jgi:hypothetical protein
MIKKSMLVLFFMLMSTILIKAQDSRAYLGPQIGWFKASGADASKPLFGGALRLKLSQAFALEAAVDYRSENYDNGAVSVTSWPVMVSAMIYPFPILYGVIGAGWYNTSITYSSDLHLFGIKDQTEQKFGWHFGAGFEIPIGGSMSSPGVVLTGDIKYVFLNYDFQTLPGSPGTSSDFVMLTVGLLFGL